MPLNLLKNDVVVIALHSDFVYIARKRHMKSCLLYLFASRFGVYCNIYVSSASCSLFSAHTETTREHVQNWNRKHVLQKDVSIINLANL